MITFVSIFSNAGLIAYTSGSFDENSRLVVFVALLITFLATKYFLRFIIPDTPEGAMIINKRHAVAIDRLVKGFGNSTAKLY